MPNDVEELMGRPKTMNATFGDFQQEVMERFRRLLLNPDWVPSESQARVLKTMAETQVILQKGKPLDEDAELPTKKARDEALAQLEARPPEAEPPAEASGEA